MKSTDQDYIQFLPYHSHYSARPENSSDPKHMLFSTGKLRVFDSKAKILNIYQELRGEDCEIEMRIGVHVLDTIGELVRSQITTLLVYAFVAWTLDRVLGERIEAVMCVFVFQNILAERMVDATGGPLAWERTQGAGFIAGQITAVILFGACYAVIVAIRRLVWSWQRWRIRRKATGSRFSAIVYIIMVTSATFYAESGWAVLFTSAYVWFFALTKVPIGGKKRCDLPHHCTRVLIASLLALPHVIYLFKSDRYETMKPIWENLGPEYAMQCSYDPNRFLNHCMSIWVIFDFCQPCPSHCLGRGTYSYVFDYLSLMTVEFMLATAKTRVYLVKFGLAASFVFDAILHECVRRGC